MKQLIVPIAAAGALSLALLLIAGCVNPPTSDDIQAAKQEQSLKQAVAEVGMPAITNFREKRELKTILELRDQSDLVTYSYMENEYPQPRKGVTALGGKLTYVGVTIGYPLPYSTQFTNPAQAANSSDRTVVIPQADPNGLYSPASADATWLMIKCPDGEVRPMYCEPRVATYPYKLAFD